MSDRARRTISISAPTATRGSVFGWCPAEPSADRAGEDPGGRTEEARP